MLALVSGCVAGGGEHDTVTSHQAARALVASALDAIGGAGAIERAGGLVVEGQGSYDLGVRLQGMRPGPGDRYPLTERLGISPATERTVYESHGHINPDADEWLRHDIRADQGYWIDLLSRRAFRGGSSERTAYRRAVPHVLLEEALTRSATLRHLGDMQIGQEKRAGVSYSTPDGVVLTLLFDPDTGLLREVEYLAELPLRGDTRVRWSFGEYRDVAGLGAYPSSYAIDLNGDRLREVTFTRISTGTESDLFDVPGDIALPEPPPSTASVGGSGSGSSSSSGQEDPHDIREVAPGVHLFVNVRGGFHMLFVEFEDHVVAVDAPAAWNELHQLPIGGASEARASRVGARYLEGIRWRVPDKPVRYVVATHAHSDHLGGVLPFLKAGATVLGTATTRRALEQLLARPARLSAGGAALPTLRFELVEGERVLRDDSMELHILDVGTNPHAEGMLAIHLPRQDLLYVSDLFEPASAASFPSPARVPVMRWFVQWLDASGLEPDQIFAVHGSARVTDEQLQRIRELSGTP